MLDVGAVTAFAVLTDASHLSVWVLYLLPLAAAGAIGLGPAVLAGGLTLVGYAALAGLNGWTASPAALWPMAVLAVMAMAEALLPSRWMAEWRERRAWDALAAEQERARRERVLTQTASRLLATVEPQWVGQAVVDAASACVPAAAEVVTDGRAGKLGGDESAAVPEPPSVVVLSLGAACRLRVTPRLAPLDGEQREWLRRLAGLAEMALIRCEQHHDLQAEQRRLQAMWGNAASAGGAVEHRRGAAAGQRRLPRAGRGGFTARRRGRIGADHRRWRPHVRGAARSTVRYWLPAGGAARNHPGAEGAGRQR